MKVSYNWLQNYFDKPLPSPEKLAELLTFHVFEIESVEKAGNDTVLDVKVLPDRARYVLCHKGVAYEISAILNTPITPARRLATPLNLRGDARIDVNVEDSKACPRYMARKMEGITMAPTPEWLKQSLEVLGQRSINSVVDAANLTLLDLGQPLHIFDADKLTGTITVRYAKAGEKITTLDNKEIILDEKILVIADDAGPLVIAGIKGGTRAEVTQDTKNIIIESANFNPSLIRKTSTKIGIRTDASKHYENAISPELVSDGMEKVTALICTINAPKSVSEITDIYPNPVLPWSLSISSSYISDRLGITLDEKTISDIFTRLQLPHVVSKNIFTLTIPTWRGDLTLPEDLVEEVGRIYGYDKIPSAQLPKTSFKPQVEKNFYYQQKIKEILTGLGFSEVITYVFGEKGELELEKSLASDKAFLRSSLLEGIKNSLELNVRNADLLGLDQIKIFEIGTVFAKEGEYTELALGVKNAKKLKQKEGEVINLALEKINEILGAKLSTTTSDGIYSVNLTKALEQLPLPTSHETTSTNKTVIKYKPFSQYPFSVRDIAVFTPEGTEEKIVREIIEKEAGALLVRNTLFDVFTKKFEDGITKTSYAFRLVLQSYDKTLTEEEINSIMNSITKSMNGREGWRVR